MEDDIDEKRFLSESEAMIMQIVWRSEEDYTISELISTINHEYGKDYKRSTVVTFLARMEAKGFIRIWHKGRIAYVHALQDRQEYRSNILRRQKEQWFNGNAAEVVASMLQSNQVTQSELDEIRRLIDAFSK